MQDIQVGRGICLLDVHGDLIEKVVKDIPTYRKKDIVYIDSAHWHLSGSVMAII